MATFPVPPPDLSGGYAEITLTDAIDSHVVRVHLQPFGASSPYTYSSAHGSETTVNDTLQAFMAKLQGGYDNTWDMFVSALVRNSGGTLTPMFPLPAAAASGSNGLAAVTADDIARCTVNTFTMRTANPAGVGKYVLRLPSWGTHYTNESSPTHTTGDIPQEKVLVQGDSGGTIYQKLIAYVTGGSGATGLVAHNGYAPTGIASQAVTENKRLRRRYGFA